MTFTKITDVKNRWVGDFLETGITDTQLQLFIEDLEEQAAYAIDAFEENVTAGKPPVKIVVSVISSAIIEYIISALNPYSSESQSTGEYSRSVSSSDRYRKKLVLNSDDIGKLSPKYDTSSEAWVIGLGAKPKRFDWNRTYYFRES